MDEKRGDDDRHVLPETSDKSASRGVLNTRGPEPAHLVGVTNDESSSVICNPVFTPEAIFSLEMAREHAEVRATKQVFVRRSRAGSLKKRESESAAIG